jgi:hypothetical protein
MHPSTRPPNTRTGSDRPENTSEVWVTTVNVRFGCCERPIVVDTTDDANITGQ